MRDNIKVAIWGFGAMGRGVALALLLKKGIEITAVCDINPAIVGKTVSEVLGKGNNGAKITPDFDFLSAENCDICILATDSFTQKAFPKMEFIAKKGINIITTAEEMAYPKANAPELAEKLDKIAKENKISILGTGINPGMVMDLLAIVLSGAMVSVDSVMCKRINSLSPFGKTVMEEQGVGLSVSEFNKLADEGHMAGHVGFKESVAMICDGIGLEVDCFNQQMEPIIAKKDRKAPYGEAKVGDVCGVNMTAQGRNNGQVVIDMVHPQQIDPEAEEIYTGDYIELKGEPPISMKILPEIDGGVGTIALCINCIPHVINSRPGLITMLDIPVPRAIMGDYRELLY